MDLIVALMWRECIDYLQYTVKKYVAKQPRFSIYKDHNIPLPEIPVFLFSFRLLATLACF